MKLSTLLTLGIATALMSAGAVVGCSEPDVANFEGSGAQPSADDDDDDESSSRQAQSKGDDDDDTAPPKKKKTDGKTQTPTDTTTTPAKPPTQQECFTHCVSPVPEAVVLDACTLKCPDNDTECLGDCYDSSNCGANPLCDQAVAQCGTKCPVTS